MSGFAYDRERRLLRVGELMLPALEVEWSDRCVPDYTWHTRVVRVPVDETGWWLSVIWGTGTYSTNHDADIMGGEFTEEPDTVEVAVFDEKGEFAYDESWDDSVVGYADPERVREVLSWAMQRAGTR